MTTSDAPQLFGTDGVRDLAGEGRLAPGTVARLGRALARFARGRGGSHRILLGRDPRPSGPDLVQQLATAMTTEGAEVIDAGVLPSPALAWLTADGDFALGCAISASHNPANYNGIKPFLGDGRKLTVEEELQIEAALDVPGGTEPPQPAHTNEALGHRYVGTTREALAAGGDLAGLRLAIDLSAGAATATAPAVLEGLGVEATYLHAADTRPINEDCGTQHPEAWLEAVRAGENDGGLAFDGDADRVLVADETGALLDGDDLLAILATDALARGGVDGDCVVGTVMANLGLHEYLAEHGVALARTPVGDRNVAERMRAVGSTLGGEPAGHIVLPRTDLPGGNVLIGDGLVAGVQVLQAARRMRRPLSELRALRPRRPQTLVNVRMKERRPLDDWPAFEAAREAQEARLGDAGRFVIRYSGTEPLLRIMAEGHDEALVHDVVKALADVARAEAN